MKAIISLDLDNVLRDQIGSIIEAVELKYDGARLNRGMFDRWDPPLGQYIGVPEADFTKWAWGNLMIFTRSQPFPGVVQILEKLIAHHQIVITTATAWPEVTIPWLRWWDIPYDKVIHTKDKGEVPFDVHIDDSPTTLQALAQAGRRVIRFDLPWNRHLVSLPTMMAWDEAAYELICSAAKCGTPMRQCQT